MESILEMAADSTGSSPLDVRLADVQLDALVVTVNLKSDPSCKVTDPLLMLAGSGTTA